MMLAARGAFLAARRKPRLPYDAEVEYLESTGTQWIDTGYIYNPDSVFSCDAMLTAVPSDTYAAMFGALQNYQGVFIALNDTVPIQARFGSSSVANLVSDLSVQNAVGVRHTYKLAARRLDIDDRAFVRSGFTFSAVNRGVWVCSANDSIADNLTKRPCSLRLFGFKILDNALLVRDFAPVRFTNEQGVSEGAMYDRANPTVGMNPDGSPRTDGLYRNRGRGAFLYGSDKTA